MIFLPIKNWFNMWTVNRKLKVYYHLCIYWPLLFHVVGLEAFFFPGKMTTNFL